MRLLWKPRLTVQLFQWKVSSFHFFGVTGFLCGTALGVFLCGATHLNVGIILLMSLTGAGVFFLLAIGVKIITGEESIVYYHHEIAILVTCSIILKLMQEPVLPYLDISILGVATFLAFGRIGCYSVGCCHGKPARNGVRYGHDHVKSGFTSYYEGITLFPIQLVESFFVFIVIIIGSILLLRNSIPGTVLILYTGVYGAFRFVVEFFRGDAERPYLRGLSEAQWTTLLLVFVSIVFGLTGMVPLYEGHLLLSLLLFATSLLIVVRRNPLNEIVTPAHIRQLASVLSESADSNASLDDVNFQSRDIRIFQTDLGLKLSKGQFVQGEVMIRHYTISCKNEKYLTYSLVRKLATIIQVLQKHGRHFEISEKQNAVFHILFKE